MLTFKVLQKKVYRAIGGYFFTSPNVLLVFCKSWLGLTNEPPRAFNVIKPMQYTLHMCVGVYTLHMCVGVYTLHMCVSVYYFVCFYNFRFSIYYFKSH